MIVVIYGPQGCGKTRLAQIILKVARLAGIQINVYGTNYPHVHSQDQVAEREE